MHSGALIAKAFPILERAPSEPGGYVCKNETNAVEYVCSPHDFCSDSSISYRVNYEGDYTNYDNWFTQYGLVCKPKAATAILNTIGFASVFLGCLFIPRLADLYGRKGVYMVSMMCQAPVFLVLTFTHSLMVAYAAAFFFGLCVIGRVAAGFLLLMELVPTKWQPVVGGIAMVAEASSLMLWVIFLTQVSKKAEYFLMYSTGLNFALLIPICFIQESPRWLYGMSNFDKCGEVLTKMAAWNGVKDYKTPQFEVNYSLLEQEANVVLDVMPSSKGR